MAMKTHSQFRGNGCIMKKVIALSASANMANNIGASAIQTVVQANTCSTCKPDIQKYCEDQLDAIRRINGIESLHTPIAFVGIAAFIGYLSRLAYGNNKVHDPDAKFYIKFVTDVMGAVKSDYKAIASDLYYVFRCGIVHSMSFKPPIDATAPTYNIAISHDTQTQWRNGNRFYTVNKNGILFTVLNADDMICDLFKSIDYMFSDPILQQHAIKFGNVQPPIQGL